MSRRKGYVSRCNATHRPIGIHAALAQEALKSETAQRLALRLSQRNISE